MTGVHLIVLNKEKVKFKDAIYSKGFIRYGCADRHELIHKGWRPHSTFDTLSELLQQTQYD